MPDRAHLRQKGSWQLQKDDPFSEAPWQRLEREVEHSRLDYSDDLSGEQQMQIHPRYPAARSQEQIVPTVRIP
jgi:hypothetical protein